MTDLLVQLPDALPVWVGGAVKLTQALQQHEPGDSIRAHAAIVASLHTSHCYPVSLPVACLMDPLQMGWPPPHRRAASKLCTAGLLHAQSSAISMSVLLLNPTPPEHLCRQQREGGHVTLALISLVSRAVSVCLSHWRHSPTSLLACTMTSWTTRGWTCRRTSESCSLLNSTLEIIRLVSTSCNQHSDSIYTAAAGCSRVAGANQFSISCKHDADTSIQQVWSSDMRQVAGGFSQLVHPQLEEIWATTPAGMAVTSS